MIEIQNTDDTNRSNVKCAQLECMFNVKFNEGAFCTCPEITKLYEKSNYVSLGNTRCKRNTHVPSKG